MAETLPLGAAFAVPAEVLGLAKTLAGMATHAHSTQAKVKMLILKDTAMRASGG